MALQQCLECGKDVSSQAVACPNCGAPTQSESPLLKQRKTPAWVAVVVLLAFVGVGGAVFFSMPAESRKEVVQQLDNSAKKIASTVAPDPISQVKGGYLEFDKGITVGNAFDHYQYFSNVEWKTFEADNKRRVVQATCKVGLDKVVTDAYCDKIDKLVGGGLGEIGSGLKKDKDKLAQNMQRRVKSMTILVQFSLNADNTFQIAHASYSLAALDEQGAVKEIAQDWTDEITSATFPELYRNEPLSLFLVLFQLSM